MLFGGFGGGLFGGIGLIEILVIGGGILLLMSYLKRRQPAPAYPQGYGEPSWQPAPQASVATLDTSSTISDLEQGIRHVRQVDQAFDPVRFQETASDLFFKIQAAWASRDMTSVGSIVTPEMLANLQRDADRLKAERKINRLENIAVRSSELTEAWQESGLDYVTVRFLANLLDYTVDETSGAIVDGSKSEPVKFEEYWTFVRSVGSGAWRLTAIQQP
jgi:predicted lipid-binding transport protein (Tim44 family)